MIPNPLHPAIVHFPIAFLLLGGVIAFCSLFFLREQMTLFAAILLIFGAGFAYLAEETGGNAADSFLTFFPDSTPTLDNHAEWADLTIKTGVAAGLLAVFAFLLRNKAKFFLLFRVLMVLAASAAIYCVYETADHGGDMVYREALKLSGSDRDHDAL